MVTRRTDVEPGTANTDAIERVKPSRSIAATHKSVPNAMYGRRRPKRHLHESDSMPACGRERECGIDASRRAERGDAPTTGWTISPERGPAAKTSAMCDLDTPSDSRYGGAGHADNPGQLWAPSRQGVGDQGGWMRTICHLDGPEDGDAEEAARERGQAKPARAGHARLASQCFA